MSTSRTLCSRCIYDAETPSITFDGEGVCNYCRLYDQLDRQYPTGPGGEAILQEFAARIREAGRKKPFDCVVGVSGGCDSSYMLHLAKNVLGLRPLAVHFDNTWDSTIAVENIHNVLKKLDIELFTLVVDNEEYDDLYRAILLAGVPDLEAPTDIALASTLYLAAEKYGIKYILEGHSFRTEGVSPLGWLYMDGRYIRSLHEAYGKRELKTYPNMSLFSFLKWTAWRGIKKIRPLYYVNYQKEEVKAMLTREFGWQWYGGHHLENRMTAFYHSYFLPKRWGIDQRVNGYSAMMRTGQMSREEGLRLMQDPPQCDPGIVEMVKTRLGFSDSEFEGVMLLPKRSFREFKTYKRTFERLRALFWVLYKLDRVPASFYIKYTSKNNI